MKKLITLIFAAILSLAVINVMATDKESKKSKNSKKVKVNKNLLVKQSNIKTAENAKNQPLKAITLDELKRIKQKAATK